MRDFPMPKLKIQFHLHTKKDPIDNIKHTETELIDEAARLGYEVLAITCHNVLIFDENLQKYAEKKRILLIPAIEKSIHGKHVVIINADIQAQNINNFEDLKTYRKTHPNILVIAAHPYYPGSICLKKDLEKHIDLFDAIEYSWYHSKKLNQYNEKAVAIAEKYKKPLVGTADNHILKYLNMTYSIVEAEKNVPAIFKAIKENKIHIVSLDLPWWKLFTIITYMLITATYKKFALKS